MTQTHFYIIIGLLIIVIAFMTFNSCNKTETDNTEILKLIDEKSNRSDSLLKAGLDSLYSIKQRDSIHSITIHNIFNNAKEKNKEIINKPFSNDLTRRAENILDSVIRANK